MNKHNILIASVIVEIVVAISGVYKCPTAKDSRNTRKIQPLSMSRFTICATVKYTYSTSFRSGGIFKVLSSCENLSAIRLKGWKFGLRRSTIDSRIPKKWWTPGEEDLLIENYPNASTKKIVELFPDRRMSSISYKARSQGLRRDCQCHWTDEEIAYLKKSYLEESMQDIRSNIRCHSVTSIWTKASELGLNKLKSGKYYWPKKNDITILKLFNQGLTHQQIAEKFFT
jgi:hypothetical protein